MTALHFPHKDGPLAGYTVGAFLGDGGLTQSVNLRSRDPEIIDRCIEDLGEPSSVTDAEGVSPRAYWSGVLSRFREAGMYGHSCYDKSIPTYILEGSYEQRLDCLQGLMDTDGHCSTAGQAIFSTVSPQLRDDVVRLVRSLGGECSWGHHNQSGFLVWPKFADDSIMFHVPRKKERTRKRRRKVGQSLLIKEVRKTAEIAPMTCFAVDADDKLFVGPEATVTHNTEMAAGLGLYHLVAEEDSVSPSIVCAAASDDQADLVFGAASNMCRWGSISSVTDPKHKVIQSRHNMGEFHRLAAASGTNDGKNISATLVDELHEWLKPNARAIFDVITQGGGARPEYYNIMITTPGHDQDSICYEFYEQVKDSIDGVKDDDTLYGLIFEAPPEADHRDPKTWELANPAYGKLVHDTFFADMIEKRRESVFRRYFAGQWVETEEVWEAAALWDGLATDVPYELDPDLPLYVGIDIGLKHDSTAVAMVQWNKAAQKMYTKFKIWQNPHPKRSAAYKDWRLSIAEVENFLRELRESFPVAAMHDEDEDWPILGPAFFYDPHMFSRSAQLLSPDGLNMVEVPQTDTIMTPASQRIFTLIKDDELVHEGDPAVRKQIRSVVPTERERGWRISKTKASKAIDVVIGLAMAAFYAISIQGEMEDEDDAPSIY